MKINPDSLGAYALIFSIGCGFAMFIVASLARIALVFWPTLWRPRITATVEPASYYKKVEFNHSLRNVDHIASISGGAGACVDCKRNPDQLELGNSMLADYPNSLDKSVCLFCLRRRA